MSAPTRVLMVEDRPEDRELIEHELKNAKILFEMVKAEGMENTRVVIVQ